MSTHPFPSSKFHLHNGPSSCRVSRKRESLRRIAISYHTSYEAVRRVLSAARRGVLESKDVQSTHLSSEGESLSLTHFNQPGKKLSRKDAFPATISAALTT